MFTLGLLFPQINDRSLVWNDFRSSLASATGSVLKRYNILGSIFISTESSLPNHDGGWSDHLVRSAPIFLNSAG